MPLLTLRSSKENWAFDGVERVNQLNDNLKSVPWPQGRLSSSPCTNVKPPAQTQNSPIRSPTRGDGGRRGQCPGAALLVKRSNSKWSLPPPGGGSGGGGEALTHVGALSLTTFWRRFCLKWSHAGTSEQRQWRF